MKIHFLHGWHAAPGVFEVKSREARKARWIEHHRQVLNVQTWHTSVMS